MARFLLVAIMSLLLLALGGCTCPVNKEEADSRPVIHIGGYIYPPFVYMDETGQPAGIDVELSKEAFGRMGYRAEYTIIDWKNKSSILNEKRVDCLWDCFTMDGREDQYQWAGPYMKSNHVVAVPKDSDIYQFADLEDKNVAVQTTSRAEEIFLSHKDPRLPQVRNLISVDTGDILYTLLLNRKVEAVSSHREALLRFAQDYDAQFRVLDEPLTSVHIGVAFAKQDGRGLAQELDRQLQDMKRDGTVRRIVAKYLDDVDAYVEGDNGGEKD